MPTPPSTKGQMKGLKGLRPSQKDVFRPSTVQQRSTEHLPRARHSEANSCTILSLLRLLPAVPLQSPTWASHPCMDDFHSLGTSLPAWPPLCSQRDSSRPHIRHVPPSLDFRASGSDLAPACLIPALPVHVTHSRPTEPCLSSTKSSFTYLATVPFPLPECPFPYVCLYSSRCGSTLTLIKPSLISSRLLSQPTAFSGGSHPFNTIHLPSIYHTCSPCRVPTGQAWVPPAWRPQPAWGAIPVLGRRLLGAEPSG